MEIRKGETFITKIDSYNDINLGNGKPAFIYEGGRLVHPSPVKEGLQLWYDFKAMQNTDDSRETAVDLSGNGNHGALQGFDYTAESGYNGTGLVFDDGHIVSGGGENLYTLEAVFKSEHHALAGIIGNYKYTDPRTGLSISTHTDGIIRFYYADGSTSQRTETVTVTAGNVHHVVLMYADERVQGYVDGECVVDVATEYHPYNEASTGEINVGKWSPFYYDYRLQGAIYSCRAYDRALTADELQHNYEMEKERFGI